MIENKADSHYWSWCFQVYETPAKGLCILQAQIDANPSDEANEDAGVDLPPFFDVDRNLNGSQDEQQYGAYSLSLIDKTVLNR
jgi:hypothetical protein